MIILPPALSKRDGHKRSSLVSALVSTPSSRSGGGTVGGARVQPSSSSKADTARRHIVSELLQTEKNFVDILHIIVKVSGNGSLIQKLKGVGSIMCMYMYMDKDYAQGL